MSNYFQTGEEGSSNIDLGNLDLTETNTIIASGNDIVSSIDINLGSKTDTEAESDTGNFSLIALFKRLLTKLELFGLGNTLDGGFQLDMLTDLATGANQLTMIDNQSSGINVLTSIDTKLNSVSSSGSFLVSNVSFKNFRGKQVTVSGSNIVNDIKINYSDLFVSQSIDKLWLEFPENIEICFTSIDNVDTDYRTLLSGKNLNMVGINVSNIKIKSENSQTGFIYTAGF